MSFSTLECKRKDVLDRASDAMKARDIDVQNRIHNPWKWSWLEGEGHLSDGSKYFLSEVIRKLDVPGKAICIVCDKEINYGGRGYPAIRDHCDKDTSKVKPNKHKLKLQLVKSNYRLNIRSTTTSSEDVPRSSGDRTPYGLHPMFLSSPVVPPSNVPRPCTPIQDRTTNAEAKILGFIAEENLPFAIAPKLVSLAKDLSTDKKALEKTCLSRTAASYKMQHGLAKTFQDELINDLKKTPFSLNIDEATSNNKMRVLSILVSYFKDTKVITRHLKSISLINVNAQSLYDAITSIFAEFELPWTNLLSILMDSCAVMRGSKSGLETRIRTNKAPHLLDIDGDTCHHAHNAAKKLCAPFDYHIEGLVKDLHTDFMWSADLRESLQEICQILNIKYTQPRNYIPHRWLSIYDTGSDLSRLLPALTLFYYGFVSEEDKKLYLPTVLSIYKQYGLSNEARTQVIAIRKRCANKSGMTKEGKERKNRIISKLFHLRRQTKLYLSFYLSVLPLLQKYVKTFEMTEPLLHKLNDYQTELLTDLFVCFLKPEVITTAKDLKNVDVKNVKNLLPKKDMFLGKAASDTKLFAKGPVTTKFLDIVQQAYQECAQQLQKTMPLNNTFLKCASAIDPVEIIRGHTETLKNLLKLPSLAKCVLNEEQKIEYDQNCRKYIVSLDLPAFNNTRADKWWCQSVITERFPMLAKMALSLLSNFHGPQVESSFSAMNQIIDSQSSNLTINSFGAIQTVRYHLKSADKTSIQYFGKPDFKHEPVNPTMVKNLKYAWKKHRQEQNEVKARKEQKKTDLKLSHEQTTSKRKFAESEAVAAKRSRDEHAKKVKKKAMKQSSEKHKPPHHRQKQKEVKGKRKCTETEGVAATHSRDEPAKKVKKTAN